jgi:hypothetical protein
MAKSRQKYLSESEWEELTGNTGNSLTEEDLEALINEPLEVEVVVPEALSPSEVKERKRLERKVERAFYEAGKALKELRDKRLYRNTHFTFEEYCQDRFGHSRQKSNFLIAGAMVYEYLAENRCRVLPSAEYQVRPLGSLPEEQQKWAWEEAVSEAGGKIPPHRLVKQVVKRLKDKVKSPHFHYPGEVCLILGGDEPKLRGKKGCWGIVTAIHEYSCDLKLWNETVDLIRPEYFQSLGYSEAECERMAVLCERIRQLLDGADLESTACSILAQLGQIKRPYLTSLEEKLLALLEREYGRIQN